MPKTLCQSLPLCPKPSGAKAPELRLAFGSVAARQTSACWRGRARAALQAPRL